jgi:hypothetical protein
MARKSRKNEKISYFEVLDVLLRAEGFFCNLDDLYGPRDRFIVVFQLQIFSNFWSSKLRIRTGTVPGTQPKMLYLDPDPYQTNMDPKHCQKP